MAHDSEAWRLTYQIDIGITRLLWVGQERTIESFQQFFTVIGEEIASKTVFVCSDMWEPYLKVIRQKCSQALHILDRFHIVANMNKALDKVRAEETSRCAYLLKEAFQQLWDYNSAAWAGKFLDEWCRQTIRSRIEPMKKIARSLREHRELILNYFRAQKLISRGVVEGLNNKAKVTMRILRISHLPSARTGTLSLTWQAARARIYPRFLLTNHYRCGFTVRPG